MSYEPEIPCGKILGHGENCQEGHLCGACTKILRLQGQLEKKTECKHFICGSCHLVQYPEMFGEEHPDDAEGIPWAGSTQGSEETISCDKKSVCKEYKPRNGTKKPFPKITDDYRDAFIAVLLITLGNITKRDPMISIKKEALESFPDDQHPVFIWNNTKQDWSVMLPPPKKKILTPNKRIIT